MQLQEFLLLCNPSLGGWTRRLTGRLVTSVASAWQERVRVHSLWVHQGCSGGPSSMEGDSSVGTENKPFSTVTVGKVQRGAGRCMIGIDQHQNTWAQQYSFEFGTVSMYKGQCEGHGTALWPLFILFSGRLCQLALTSFQTKATINCN